MWFWECWPINVKINIDSYGNKNEVYKGSQEEISELKKCLNDSWISVWTIKDHSGFNFSDSIESENSFRLTDWWGNLESKHNLSWNNDKAIWLSDELQGIESGNNFHLIDSWDNFQPEHPFGENSIEPKHPFNKNPNLSWDNPNFLIK